MDRLAYVFDCGPLVKGVTKKEIKNIQREGPVAKNSDTSAHVSRTRGQACTVYDPDSDAEGVTEGVSSSGMSENYRHRNRHLMPKAYYPYVTESMAAVTSTGCDIKHSRRSAS